MIDAGRFVARVVYVTEKRGLPFRKQDFVSALNAQKADKDAENAEALEEDMIYEMAIEKHTTGHEVVIWDDSSELLREKIEERLRRNNIGKRLEDFPATPQKFGRKLSASSIPSLIKAGLIRGIQPNNNFPLHDFDLLKLTYDDNPIYVGCQLRDYEEREECLSFYRNSTLAKSTPLCSLLLTVLHLTNCSFFDIVNLLYRWRGSQKVPPSEAALYRHRAVVVFVVARVINLTLRRPAAIELERVDHLSATLDFHETHYQTLHFAVLKRNAPV